MQRREFLLKSSLIAAAGIVPALPLAAQSHAPAAPAGTPSSTAEFVPLRRNVGYYRDGGSTIAWLASPQALVAVDSYFPKGASDLIDRLPGRNGRSIDVLINSHHHPDHVGGNSSFRPITKQIVAQRLVPEVQLAQAKERNTVNYQIYADTLFDNDWRFDAGDEVVSVKYVGYPSHTTSDSVVHFEKANVVQLADLVFNRYYPMIDRPGGCDIKAWIKALEWVVATYPKDAIYIFGHARKGYPLTGTQAEVLAIRDYLSGLLEFTGKAIKEGKSRDEHIGLQEIPGFPEWVAPQPNFIARNLGGSWDELTGVPRPEYKPFVNTLYKA